MRRARARACANIALVKYWGKRDEALNLPLAGSLSLTLDGLDTETEVTFGATGSDALFIDGAPAAPAALHKALRVVQPLRARAGLRAAVEIHSKNSFPAAAGLASSASGLAALTVASARALGLELSPPELSVVARLGSGSACRSIFGGFVEWLPGTARDGSDSHGQALQPPEHWDLRVLVAVIASGPKAVGSTRGMLHTQRTSPLLAGFIASVAEDLLAARRAIAERDLAALGRVAERSCLRMHATMIGAEPSLRYLRAASWRVIDEVQRARDDDGLPAFFTADAGPNVKVFCAPEAAPELQRRIAALGCVERFLLLRPGAGAEVREP